MSATRLPGKPLLKINRISIISNVYKKALESNIGEVYVATEDKEIFEDVVNNGGKSIITSNKHLSGTDRIFEAYKKLNTSNIDYVLNLQGDEPLINSDEIKKFNDQITNSNFDMATLACEIEEGSKYTNENVVKVKTKDKLITGNSVKAIDFFRKIENDDLNNVYHHIGIYLYKVEVLEKIVSMDQTKREKHLKLEQLRALENNIEIHVNLSKFSPIGIDTKEDYYRVKNLLERKN